MLGSNPSMPLFPLRGTWTAEACCHLFPLTMRAAFVKPRYTYALAQSHKEPTREENILDLLITNKPGLIKSSHSVPGISDHCAVVTELDIDPPHRRTKPRPVRQFKKANWEAIRQQIRSCWTSFS